jgi:chromosomal replication initiator protein
VKAPPAVVAIAQEVADEHGFTLEQLVSPALRRDIARARWVCWGRIRAEVRFVSGPPSLPQIGKWFGNRDHTTVLHGLRRLSEVDCSAPVRIEVAA